jgi:replicative DNA helicase Mcm
MGKTLYIIFMFDNKTEVLTESGWKLFKDLLEDSLATVNPSTFELIFEKPTEIIAVPYSGNLICAKNLFLNFKLTYSHNMLVRKWIERDRTLSKFYEFVPIKKIGWYSGLLNNIIWNGSEKSNKFIIPGVEHKQKPQRLTKEVSMKSWLKFWGIFLAEGTVLGSYRKKKQLYKIQLACSKKREKTFIKKVLKELDLHFLELKDRITFERKQIYKLMENFKGVHAPFKYVPQFVFKQPAKNIKQILLGHVMGDGCIQNNLKSHYTSSFRLADDLQLLIFLSGNESRITERSSRMSVMKDGRNVRGKFPEYRISVCEKKNLSIERKKTLFNEPYEGIVYTAKMPTYHTLVTRRNKKIFISG